MWADAPWFVSSTMELQVFYGGRIPRKLNPVTINNSELSRFACMGRAPPPFRWYVRRIHNHWTLTTLYLYIPQPHGFR